MERMVEAHNTQTVGLHIAQETYLLFLTAHQALYIIIASITLEWAGK
jgi:hypothetical protein